MKMVTKKETKEQYIKDLDKGIKYSENKSLEKEVLQLAKREFVEMIKMFPNDEQKVILYFKSGEFIKNCRPVWNKK
jgi:hypothetical protein